MGNRTGAEFNLVRNTTPPPTDRRRGTVLRYMVRQMKGRPQYEGTGRPDNWDEFADFFLAWYNEQKQWMEWVRKDLEDIEAWAGTPSPRAPLTLAPPPPPEDPWD